VHIQSLSDAESETPITISIIMACEAVLAKNLFKGLTKLNTDSVADECSNRQGMDKSEGHPMMMMMMMMMMRDDDNDDE